MADKEKIELEAWFTSNVDRARWPSSGFGRSMSAGQPFKVVQPEAILFFNDVANHNEWLKKIKVSDAHKIIGPKETDIHAAEFVKNRQFADEKIADLMKENEYLKNTNIAKDEAIVKLESDVEDLQVYKEKFEVQEAQIKKLKTALTKAKNKAKKSSE